jgi:putative phosphoribosyl transferase
VARSLSAPLDVILVRKLGVPQQPELGMGAIGEDGVRVLNPEIIEVAKVSGASLARVEAAERAELERRAQRFRSARPRVPLEGRTAVVIDDGIATGSTARAACEVARAHGAARVVLAVPVAPPEWTQRLADAADELVAVETPTRFAAIGQFYEDFRQVSDDEVLSCLDGEVRIPVGRTELHGHLVVPQGATGVVVFAHGSGSSRHSARNRFVAEVLRQAGIGTLLFDLLTAEEAGRRANVFDVELLAGRLIEATRWLRARTEVRVERARQDDGASASSPGVDGCGAQPHGDTEVRVERARQDDGASASSPGVDGCGAQPHGDTEVPLGYFGASTGAAAALWAAAEPGNEIAAVVSRGGRPDLAGPRLAMVKAPTLLIVGSRDETVLELNRRAEAELRCPHRLAVVPGATHLFAEPGTLEAAASLARDWFLAAFSGRSP